MELTISTVLKIIMGIIGVGIGFIFLIFLSGGSNQIFNHILGIFGHFITGG
jgi:hypothetical protein